MNTVRQLLSLSSCSLSRVRERAGVRVADRHHPHPSPLPRCGRGSYTGRLAALTLALAAAGCTTVGPDYQRPAVTLPAQFPQAAASTTSTTSTAAIAPNWWTLYGEAELTHLVDQALLANADIAQAVARVQQAEGQLREASGALVPTVNAGANAARSEIGASVPTNTSGRTITGNDLKLSLSTSFEIDFWGKLARASEAARAQLLAGNAARDTVRLTVAGSVAQAWFALRSLDAQVAATRGTLKSREDSARLIGLRLKAGTGSRLDSEQAEILRADSALQLRELQRQRALAQSLLGVLTGDPALTLAEGSLNSAVPPAPPAGLPSELLDRRPDIRRAEGLLMSNNALVGVAKAAMFPTLSLTGALGNESGALSTLLKTPAHFWSLGFGLTAPIFDGGRNAARVDQADGRRIEAVGAYQSAVSTAFKEVADALANSRAARESQPDTERRAASAETAERLAKARFDAGYSGYLELLDAQRTATAARLDVVRNRQAQLNASVDLFKALGGGWAAP
jgi:multidrug efflux system outer membrane protein